MAENNKSEEKKVIDGITIIEPPTNITDFKVIFDPQVNKPSVPKTLHSQEDDETEPVETKNNTGFDKPIIAVNQQVLPDERIKEMRIFYTGFTPELELVVSDPKNEIQFVGGPGIRNSVIVILCPNMDGVYRSIALSFYIKEKVNTKMNELTYKCEYANISLANGICAQIGDKPLTTYDFFEKLAKILKLGFACTDKCKDVNDPKWRQMYSQRTEDFIKQQINISGTNTDEILDAWIDTHGYINLINLSYVFDEELKPTQLSIVAKAKIESDVAGTPDTEPFVIQRTLIDDERYGIANMVISNKYHKLDTEDIKEEGTDVSYWTLTGVGDTNTLVMEDIRTIDDSIEGKAKPDTYQFGKIEFLGCDMSDDTPYLMQEQIRKRWINKRKTKQLTVHLRRPNYGLERGTLINVISGEQDPRNMAQIAQNIKNTKEANKTDEERKPYNVSSDVEPLSIGEMTGGDIRILNPAFSGMYYINGMIYRYFAESGLVEQVLFLIKKSSDNNIVHAEAAPNLTPEQNSVIAEVDKFTSAAMADAKTLLDTTNDNKKEAKYTI